MLRLRGRSVAGRLPDRRTVNPDFNRFAYPASFYIDAYRAYQAAVRALESGLLNGEVERSAARAQLRERRARAICALATGGEESVPFALRMLASTDVDERADARGVFRQMGCRDQVVDSLIASLCDAEDIDTITAITVCLGEMGNARAIPSLEALLGSSLFDAHTRSLAITSLGKLAQRRFDRSEDPEGAARAWLEANGYGSALVSRTEPASEHIASTA